MTNIAAHIDRAEAILADTQPQTESDRILLALALTAVAWVRLEAGLPGEGLVERESEAAAWDEGWKAARQVVDFEDAKVWAHMVFPEGYEGNPYRADGGGQ